MQTIDYKAIARRFRPQTFAEVTGQAVIVKTLTNAIKTGYVSHAYLFCGIRGTGKTTLARLFAKALNCSQLTSETEPCNRCPSCREISAGQSLDVIEIDGASNRGIDDIRNINENLGYIASSGATKIFIIDEVHMLTKEAFNALLKSLEEPPDNVKFFFATTEPQKVLPTIVSRCQRFDLKRIESAEIIRKLRTIATKLSIEVEDDALALIARLSEGSLRDGESLLDQLISLGTFPITAHLIEESLGFATRGELFEFDEAFEEGDMAFAFDFAQKLFHSGRDFFFFIENLLSHFRNIALLRFGKLTLDAEYFTKEEQKGYSRATKIYTVDQLLYLIDYLAELLTAKNRLTFKKVHLEMTLLHLLQSRNRITIDQIVAKLDELENGSVKEVQAPVAAPVAPTSAEPVEPVVTAEPTSAAPIAPPAPMQVQERDLNRAAKHDTLMRFAQVELGGSLKKNL